MAKYSLWLTDINNNSFFIPLRREGDRAKKNRELYEIDLLTVSLGEEQFIEQLQKSNIAPKDYDWSTSKVFIKYKVKDKEYYLSPLFEKNSILVKILNFQNKYRYHKVMSVASIKEQVLDFENLNVDFIDILKEIEEFSSSTLLFIKDEFVSYEFCSDAIIPRRLKQIVNVYEDAFSNEEKEVCERYFTNELLSYTTFRKVIMFLQFDNVEQMLPIEQTEGEFKRILK